MELTQKFKKLSLSKKSKMKLVKQRSLAQVLFDVGFRDKEAVAEIPVFGKALAKMYYFTLQDEKKIQEEFEEMSDSENSTSTEFNTFLANGKKLENFVIDHFSCVVDNTKKKINVTWT